MNYNQVWFERELFELSEHAKNYTVLASSSLFENNWEWIQYAVRARNALQLYNSIENFIVRWLFISSIVFLQFSQ